MTQPEGKKCRLPSEEEEEVTHADIISYQKMKRNMILSLIVPAVWLGYIENRNTGSTWRVTEAVEGQGASS